METETNITGTQTNTTDPTKIERRAHPRVPGAFKHAEDVAYEVMRQNEEKECG
jgi:hypothetical protein